MTKLKLEAGKHYRTRDGRKVGPMEDAGYGLMGVGGRAQYYTRASSVFKEEGRTRSWGESPDDIIAEWTDTPTLKVGDKVKVIAGYGPLFNGRIGIVTHVEGDDAYVASKSNLPKDYHQGDDFHLYFWGRELEPTPTIGTLAEIGAQVGDVVEFVEWAGGNRESGMFAVGKQYTHTGDRLDSWRGYFLMADAVKHKFRIVYRASDDIVLTDEEMAIIEAAMADDRPKVSLDDANDRITEVLSRGPVITEAIKRIVPGVYGKVEICEDDSYGGGIGVYVNSMFSRDDLAEAIATLTAIRDAL